MANVTIQVLPTPNQPVSPPYKLTWVGPDNSIRSIQTDQPSGIFQLKDSESFKLVQTSGIGYYDVKLSMPMSSTTMTSEPNRTLDPRPVSYKSAVSVRTVPGNNVGYTLRYFGPEAKTQADIKTITSTGSVGPFEVHDVDAFGFTQWQGTYIMDLVVSGAWSSSNPFPLGFVDESPTPSSSTKTVTITPLAPNQPPYTYVIDTITIVAGQFQTITSPPVTQNVATSVVIDTSNQNLRITQLVGNYEIGITQIQTFSETSTQPPTTEVLPPGLSNAAFTFNIQPVGNSQPTNAGYTVAWIPPGSTNVQTLSTFGPSGDISVQNLDTGVVLLKAYGTYQITVKMAAIWGATTPHPFGKGVGAALPIALPKKAVKISLWWIIIAVIVIFILIWIFQSGSSMYAKPCITRPQPLN